MTKIVVLHIISSLRFGGAESLLCDMVKRLHDLDIENHVIYFHHGPYVEYLKNQGIPVYHVTGFFRLYDPWFFMRIYRLVKKIKPDCIHGWLWAANLATRLMGILFNIPTLCSLHNNCDQDGFFRNFLDKYTLRFADKIVPVSQGVKQSLTMHGSWVPSSKITTIKNGIDQPMIVQKAQGQIINRAALGLDTTHLVLGSVGRFVPLKNYPFLLDCFAELSMRYPYLRLILVGTGPDEQLLRTKVHDLGIYDRVVFVIDKPALGYYALFDCFVLSSFKEGISIALLEALCFGLPCVVTNTMLEHDVITDGQNGFIVSSGDKNTFIKRVSALIDDQSLRMNIGQRAQDLVREQFSAQSMTTEYYQLYKELIKNKNLY